PPRPTAARATEVEHVNTRLWRPALLLIPALSLGAASCGPRVNWNYYAPFGVIGDKEPSVSPVDPAAVHHFGVASRLHYISVVVDSVFFRNLPKTQGREVAIGIDMN